MEKATVVLNISPEVADRAKQAGILTDERVEKLIVAELERQENARLFIDDIKAIAAAGEEITPEDIEREITAHRAENR